MNLDTIRQAFQRWQAAAGMGPVLAGPWFGRRAVYLLNGSIRCPGTVVGIEPHKHAVYLWLDEPLPKPKEDMDTNTRAEPEIIPVLLVNIYDDTFCWEES